MVAFIRFCLEVFLQTFYATLPCFCKCKKCGFGWCQTFPIFSHILLNFWILEKMWYCFCILEQINTRIFQNLLLILWQTLLWAPNSMYTKSVCCLQNRSKICSGYVCDILTATKIWKKSLRTKLQNLTWKILISSWCKNTGLKSNITSL